MMASDGIGLERTWAWFYHVRPRR